LAPGATLSGVAASDFELGTTVAGYSYELSMDGNALDLTATSLSAVPEPADYALIGGGLALAGAAFRHRRLGRI
jgi:PEP-CTERM motif